MAHLMHSRPSGLKTLLAKAPKAPVDSAKTPKTRQRSRKGAAQEGSAGTSAAAPEEAATAIATGAGASAAATGADAQAAAGRESPSLNVRLNLLRSFFSVF